MTWTQYVTGTGGDGLWVHSGAGLSAPTTVVLAEGTELSVDCVSYADTIGGTDPAWLHITSPTPGWVADFYVDTLWSSDNTLVQQGLPECGTSSEQPAIPDDGSYDSGTGVPTISAPYDRDAAAQWALEHATDVQNVFFPGCTWFVSQALWAGGLPQTEQWNGSDSHGRLNHLPGTVAATAVDDFIDNLRSTYPLTTETYLSADAFRANAVPEAEVGDIIAYDWDDNSDFDHLAIVTSIAEGSYPEVAEWGTTDLSEARAWIDYSSRGWTWSALDQTWLQDPDREDATPGVTATLFHIEAPTAPTF
ncbi:amidase domain-containing protein [Nocardioides sp. C4-1]|uniref:amidase domain-containing protein n=1 Tax=Nocardioides sp. C4-1 TaxID=3151851 RepID=UPI0032647666